MAAAAAQPLLPPVVRHATVADVILQQWLGRPPLSVHLAVGLFSIITNTQLL